MSRVLLCLSISFALPSQAVVFGTADLNIDGTYTYNYTLDNTAGSFGVDLWSLNFEILPDWNQADNLAGGDVSVPNIDWFADVGTPITGSSAQDFIAFPGGGVAIGGMLSDFSFTSMSAPGAIDYFEFDTLLGGSVNGTVIGPAKRVTASVPDTSPWYISLILPALLLVRHGKRKRRVLSPHVRFQPP